MSPRPPRRHRSALSAVLAALALLCGALAAAPAQAAADLANSSPDPLFVLQGGEILQTNCSYTSQGALGFEVVKQFKADYPSRATQVYPVAYDVCDWRNGAPTGSGQMLVANAAQKLAQSITANARCFNGSTPRTCTSADKVDVVSASMGTIVSRLCLIRAYATPNSVWEPCKRIDDWVGFAPVGSGTNIATLYPVDDQTCSTWGGYPPCRALTSGPHLASAISACGVFLPAATKVCAQLGPSSGTMITMNEGVQAGVSPPDETPGTTVYTSFFSYQDEIVMTPQTTVENGPHPSPLTGGVNIKVPYDTHVSLVGLDAATKKRMKIVGTSTPSAPLWADAYPYDPIDPSTGKPFKRCTQDSAELASRLLGDIPGTPTPSTLPCTDRTTLYPNPR